MRKHLILADQLMNPEHESVHRHNVGRNWKRRFLSENASNVKCFPSTLRWMNLKTQQSLVIWIYAWGKLGRGNHMIIVTSSIVFNWNGCRPLARENEKPAFSNSARLKSVFHKFRPREGLVWTVGLINLRFQIPSTQCGLNERSKFARESGEIVRAQAVITELTPCLFLKWIINLS